MHIPLLQIFFPSVCRSGYKSKRASLLIDVVILVICPKIHLISGRLFYKYSGSGALSGNMLLVRIVENNKMYAYLKAG